MNLNCILESISAEDATRLLADTSGDRPSITQIFYYPYHWHRCDYSLPTIFGTPKYRLDCLVDARTGMISTADRFEINNRSVHSSEILSERLEPDTSDGAIRRVASHLLMKRHRVLTPLDLKLRDSLLIYKKFWVVSQEQTRILVDTTSGSFTALNDSREAA